MLPNQLDIAIMTINSPCYVFQTRRFLYIFLLSFLSLENKIFLFVKENIIIKGFLLSFWGDSIMMALLVVEQCSASFV